jgi:hypothetical protein
MNCRICSREFSPSKYKPQQQVCGQPACQKSRQLENQKQWRLRNPDYFRSLEQDKAWIERRRRYNQLWKETNKESIKIYQKKNKKQRNQYMREYMRNYRINRDSNVNREKS